MLRITINGDEYYDESTETFETLGDVVLELEHSLVSLSKWESKFQKPFLTAGEKTSEEILEYIRAMIVTPGQDPDVVFRFSQENLDEINAYIDSSQSATTFGAMPDRKGLGEVITSELIYYWMVAFTIPFECENWHLNRLFSLVRICNLKQSKPKKKSRHEIAEERTRLNAQRREQLNTRG